MFMNHFAKSTLSMSALGLALACNVAFSQKNSIATAVPGGGAAIAATVAIPTVQLIEIQAPPQPRGAMASVATASPSFRIEPQTNAFVSAIRVCMKYNAATGSKTQTGKALHSALMGMGKQIKNKDGKSSMTGPDGQIEDDFKNNQMCETLKGF
jgi:hypothetical protein